MIELGKRISLLLASPKVQSSSVVLATLDDLLGGVYAFILAFHNQPSFKYRPVGRKIDSQVIQKRARSITQAHGIRLTGKWIAGFHFNSGLFRLLAVYHRALKITVGQPGTREQIGDATNPKSLLNKAKSKYNAWTGKQWNNAHIDIVRIEVNELKHDSMGKFWGRRVNERDAVSSVEELLDILEAWEVHG